MNKRLILITILLVIFLDFFNLGLIYPIFSSLIFEGSGGILPENASELYKNVAFGILIAAFPFGQFFGAPVIGELSDQFGRRNLLILSLLGTIVTLLLCALGVHFSLFIVLLLGRFIGGLMAGNVTLAFASLADLSTPEEKVGHFALIPFTMSAGFALGPFLAGILANPETSSWSGPMLPFLAAALLSFLNLFLVMKKFPKMAILQKEKKSILTALSSGLKNIARIVLPSPERPLFLVLFLMISSNFLFVQFIGPYATEKFHINVTGVGYLYTNLGIGAALGNLFLTRKLSKYCSAKKALAGGVISLALLLAALVFVSNFILFHLVCFPIMLACAVGYTNAMALVSNQGDKENQGEMMGIAVSIQSFSEFFPAFVVGFMAAKSESIPLWIASLCAFGCYGILRRVKNVAVSSEQMDLR